MADIYRSDIEALCEKLKLAGEESLILTASISEEKVTHFGSSVGVLYARDITDTFLQFCKDNYNVSDVQTTPERVTRASVARPTTSRRPRRKRKVPATYKDSYEDKDDDDFADPLESVGGDDDERDEDYSVELVSKTNEPEKDVKSKTPLKKIKLKLSSVKVESVEAEGNAIETVDDSTKNGEDEKADVYTSDTEEGVLEIAEPREMFSCRYCSSRFKTMAKLQKHLPTHTKFNKRHSCPQCDKEFTTASQLQRHKASHSQDRLVPCDLCDKKFKTIESVAKHKKFIHQDSAKISETLDKPKSFDCDTCEASFKTRFNLRRHMMVHMNSRPFSCEICGKNFRGADNLAKHLVRHSTDKPYKCEDCNKQFKSKGGLKIHHIVFHGDKGLSKIEGDSFKCAICGRVCGSYYALKSHIACHKNDEKVLSKSGKLVEMNDGSADIEDSTEDLSSGMELDSSMEMSTQPMDEKFVFETIGTDQEDGQNLRTRAKKNLLSCDQCDKQFTCNRDYKNHMKHHAGQRVSHACDLCGKEYLNITALYRHRKLHDKDGTYTCKACGLRYNSMESLWRHAKTHLEDKPFKCSVCHKGFIERRNRDSHYLTHTKEKPFICDQCGKAFRTQQQMKNHQGIHTGERPFKCNTCGLTFRLRDTLRNHKLVHSDFKKFMCHTCGKRFHRPAHLRNHQSVHMDVPEHVCQHCGKAFKMATSLKTHMVAHHMTAEELAHCNFKTHKCEYCGKIFRERQDHDRHLRMHTGEKPYACELCGKAFSDSSNLRTHVRNHKGDKSKACHICHKSFMFNKDLRKHMLTHSDNDPQPLYQDMTERLHNPSIQNQMVVQDTMVAPPMSQPILQPHPQPLPQPHPQSLPQPHQQQQAMSVADQEALNTAYAALSFPQHLQPLPPVAVTHMESIMPSSSHPVTHQTWMTM
ncbi:zinc finger protein 665-like isoform X2 [Pecten maximus]|uniref:zinc finger protein 665-like isoform X2 n=1 Tax=Pecten maximus TaxID=6579 RepID=UPI00145918F3|nr:zinc finger protein 665-like isoform X2 [Pecten maximus]